MGLHGHWRETPDEREARVRREYGNVRRADWDALNRWAEHFGDIELLAVVALRIPGDAGMAVEQEARRRGLTGPLAEGTHGDA